MSAASAGRFSVSGLGPYVTRTLRRLAHSPSPAELKELHASLAAASRRLEISLSLKKLDAQHLTPTARGLRAWLAFVADAENFNAYAEAVGRGRAVLEPLLASQSRWKPPVRVYLKPLRGMYHARQQRDGLEVSLPTPALCFTDADWLALARTFLDGDRSAKRHVLDRMQSDDFQAIAAELDALGGAVDDSAGQTYDLADSFDRVNAAYFGGSMKRPRLTWSRSPTFRKFGHYDWIGDTVMISRTLDAADVPEFVVDFVMYHELLHKAHGIRWTPGSTRGYAHTAAFYRDEHRFAHYAAAEGILKKLARRQRRRA